MKVKLIRIIPDDYDPAMWTVKIDHLAGEYAGLGPPHPGGWYYCPAEMPDAHAIDRLPQTLPRSP
jgi:hypothetical protein